MTMINYLSLSLASFDEITRLLVPAQQVTPDTSSYMIAGFVVIFGTMLVYLASLVIRWRNLRGDLEVLQELEKRQQAPLSSASQPEKRQLKQVKS
jgi:hypothetical protein